jgi:hypothetical protein
MSRGWALLTLLLLTGCATASPETRRSAGLALADSAGLRVQLHHDTDLPVLTASRLTEPGPVWVFIEGDGHAWQSLTQPSADPTPEDPLALRLAAASPAQAVIYLGRPCQFTFSPACQPPVWTEHRFAPESVAAMDGALTAVLAGQSPRQIVLIGYSGGASIARALMARRHDVAALVTVAGVLEPDLWTHYHHVSAITPLAPLADVKGWSQLHFSGADDRIVPPALIARTAPPGSVVVLEGVGHHQGWVERWPRLIANIDALLMPNR